LTRCTLFPPLIFVGSPGEQRFSSTVSHQERPRRGPPPPFLLSSWLILCWVFLFLERLFLFPFFWSFPVGSWFPSFYVVFTFSVAGRFCMVRKCLGKPKAFLTFRARFSAPFLSIFCFFPSHVLLHEVLPLAVFGCNGCSSSDFLSLWCAAPRLAAFSEVSP